MKKFILLLTLTGVLVSCTSKEQEEQIRSFWAQQMQYAFAKIVPGQAAPLAVETPESSSDADVREMQEFEDMMKEWEQTQNDLDPIPAPQTDFQAELSETVSEDPSPQPSSAPAEPVKPAAQAAPSAPKPAAKPKTPANSAKQLNAYLVVSSQCGWCQKLKQEGWVEQFQDKYRGQVRLIEYDVTTPEGQAGYTKLMKRYKMSSVGTPSFFVGDAVVRGYPLSDADAAVQKAIAKYGKNTKHTVSSASASSGQFMEITLEDPSGVIKGKAPLKDRQAMQRAIDKVLQDNQNAVQDIGQMFGASIQAEAFAITTKTEKALRNQAAASASLQEYLQAQRRLLSQQEQSLNQLMQANVQFIRNIR